MVISDFTVTIPADFSAALTSAAGTDPHAATISLQTNDANNYLASTIGSQAVAKIQASVTQLLGKQAALRILTGIRDTRSNLGTEVGLTLVHNLPSRPIALCRVM